MPRKHRSLDRDMGNEHMQLDLEKPLWFKGSRIEVHATPTKGGRVVLEWKNKDGGPEWQVRDRNALSLRDLVNSPDRVVIDGWFNIYCKEDNKAWIGVGGPYSTRAEALSSAEPTSIACINICQEIIVGEGLD